MGIVYEVIFLLEFTLDWFPLDMFPPTQGIQPSGLIRITQDTLATRFLKEWVALGEYGNWIYEEPKFDDPELGLKERGSSSPTKNIIEGEFLKVI